MRIHHIVTVFSLILTLGLATAAQAVDTTWNFNGNLLASSGTSTMSYRSSAMASLTSFGTTSSFGLPLLYGDSGSNGVMKFPSLTPGTSTTNLAYTVNHGVGSIVSTYTMIWDVYYPETSEMLWRGLYQTNASNSNDGDMFVGTNPWGGVGIDSTYHGAIKPNEWNRIAITRDADGIVKKYINGGYVGEQDCSLSRWSLESTGFHILTDDNGNSAGGYLSSYRFADYAMTGSQITQLGGASAGGCSTPGVLFDDPSVVEPGSYTIAVLGDSQCYVKDADDTLIFNQMTQWLVDNKEEQNIQFVMHVGDVVDNNSYTVQWDRAMTAMNTLNGQIPYAVVPGNHDYSSSRTSSQFNLSTRFGAGSAYASQSTLTGYYADPGNSGSRMNTYHTFNVNGQDYLIMSLEFGPRDDVVAWADSILDANPNHKAILLTHAYMYGGGNWFDSSVDPEDPLGRTYDQILDATYGRVRSTGNPHSYSWIASDCNDGKELWDQLVADHENCSLVITGHQYDEYDGFPYQYNEGTNGNDVYQMLFDTQGRNDGGEGWIRLLEFSADGTKLTVKTYSPYFDEWSYASDEYYTIDLNASEKLPGDANGDGYVDGSDATILAGYWQQGNATWAMGDFNGDRIVDGSDATILAGYWQQGTPPDPAQAVPEPSTILSLLALLVAGLIVVCRRQ